MVDITDISTNLKLRDDGIWYSPTQQRISYPEEGNQAYYTVEEGSFWFKHRNNCIVEVMQTFPPGGPVLDVGGGNGFVSIALKEAGLEPILLEPGHDGVINARSRGLSDIICSTLTDAGFREASIPAAGMFDVLEHIHDDTEFLKSIYRILSRGGRLYLTVPAYDFLFSTDDEEAGHYRRYTLRTLANALESSGFAVDYATYIFSFLPVPIYMFRTLPTKLGLSRKQSADRAQEEHRKPGGISGRILDMFCKFESRAIEKRGKIKFGGSCLVVARKA